MTQKSQNMTSILALIVGLTALIIAIIALVNNQQDGYSSADATCCVDSCAGPASTGWCIGTDTYDTLTFNYNGIARVMISPGHGDITTKGNITTANTITTSITANSYLGPGSDVIVHYQDSVYLKNYSRNLWTEGSQSANKLDKSKGEWSKWQIQKS